MNTTKHPSIKIPKEIPEPRTQTELIPPVEPQKPAIPMENPHIGSNERPAEISPYDFPPPGEGLFPELFTNI